MTRNSPSVKALDTPQSTMKSPALHLVDVVKEFGNTVAVNRLSLTVERNEVLALLGPNGAGKTTTIELCEGLQIQTSGSIRVLGLDPMKNAKELRVRMGIMLQGGGTYPGAYTGEMLRLISSYYADPLDTDWLLDILGLRSQVKTPCRQLSGGQQQRLALACAIVGRPELVFLDEPTAGLDAQSRLAVWDLIRALKTDGVTVVLTTHVMDEAENLADHVAIIDHGRLVAYGTPSELTHMGEHSTSIRTTGTLDIEQFHKALPFGMNVLALENGSLRIDGSATPETIAAIATECLRQGCLIRELSTDRFSLEDVFLNVTGRDLRG